MVAQPLAIISLPLSALMVFVLRLLRSNLLNNDLSGDSPSLVWRSKSGFYLWKKRRASRQRGNIQMCEGGLRRGTGSCNNCQMLLGMLEIERWFRWLTQPTFHPSNVVSYRVTRMLETGTLGAFPQARLHC